MTTMVYSIDIPAEIVHTTRMTLEEIKLELALMLFQQGKLSFGKAREMTGLTVWDFQLLLGQRKIPVHYDIQDYLADQPAIDALTKRDELSSGSFATPGT
jgi:predicted HTH domain antitoxin